MPGRYCPIHLIGRKRLHFEKNYTVLFGLPGMLIYFLDCCVGNLSHIFCIYTTCSAEFFRILAFLWVCEKPEPQNDSDLEKMRQCAFMLPKILEIEQNFSLIDGSNSVYRKFPFVYKIFTDS